MTSESLSPVSRICLLYGTKTRAWVRGFDAKIDVGTTVPYPGSVSFTEQRQEPGYGAKKTSRGTKNDESRTTVIIT